MSAGSLLAGEAYRLLRLWQRKDKSIAPFGTLLGTAAKGRVQVFSSDYLSISLFRAPFMKWSSDSGIHYQCVELARRYLMLVDGVSFASVRMAYEIFSLPSFYLWTRATRSRFSRTSMERASNDRPSARYSFGDRRDSFKGQVTWPSSVESIRRRWKSWNKMYKTESGLLG